MGLFIEMTRFQLGVIDMPVIRRPQRTSSLDGPSYVHWVLTNPNENTCWEQFRMSPHTFIALCNTLKERGFSTEQSLCEDHRASCYIYPNDGTKSLATVDADRLQRSTWTISTYLRRSCRAICMLGKKIIQPSPIEMPHPVVTGNRKYDPWFTVSNTPSLFINL
jgi:hypothetical protein